MSDRVRFGVVLPSRCGGAFDNADPHEAIALAERAEALGFDSVWAGESILARPRHEPLTLLAAVAARTERMTIGTATLIPALHAPLQLAQRLASLDVLSRGRLIVGAGIAIDNEATRREFAAAGVPFEQRVGRLVETIRACRTLWSDDPGALADDAPGRLTKYWDLRGALLHPRPHRAGGPPFWLGSTFAKDASLQRVGRLADGWLPTSPSAAAHAAGWDRVRAAAQQAGRKLDAVTPAVFLTVCLDDDPRVAEAALAPYMAEYYGLPYEVMRKVQGVFAGTPDACAAWLRSHLDAGATHVVLRSPDLAGQLEVLARELLPRLGEERR
jgi:alkanesulfonate monooxygenase SsuD/methylene tetrahydromethanopterin reductase-like flavin-dependent oxidoreductase (luciferase family)